MNEAASAEHAAQQALGTPAKEENLKAVAELKDLADPQQQHEHIRGIVATTIAHLSSQATAKTREQAAQWQAWALGLVDGPAAAGT